MWVLGSIASGTTVPRKLLGGILRDDLGECFLALHKSGRYPKETCCKIGNLLQLKVVDS